MKTVQEIQVEGKSVGRIMKTDSGKMFYYTARAPKHYMVKFKGYGISDSVIQTLRRENVQVILIGYVAKDYMRYYMSDLRQWVQSTKKFTFCGDEQSFLSTPEMKEKDILDVLA
jgi:hypothetical protein